ncbi:MAG: PAS domain S-box protein [Bacteroidia bacterium]|nr:PAS domain S-box protein [Bacteroidia bacterium]
MSQLSGIIDSSKSGIIALDREYRIVAANTRSREIIKQFYNSTFRIHDQWFEVLTQEEDKAKYKKMWDKALSGQSFATEDSRLDKQNNRVWLEISLNPILSESQEIIGASLFMRDITERMRAQKNTELTAHILNNSTNEVYVFDAQSLKFVYANERACTNLGYTLDELKEKTPYEIEIRFTRESFYEHIAPLERGEIKNLLIETTYHRKDGTAYEVALNLQYFEDQDKPLFAAIAQDVTQRKRHEQALEDALERFNLAISATQEGIWEMPVVPADPINPDNAAWWSRTFKTLLGFEENEFEDKLHSWSARLHPDDRELTLRALYNHIMSKDRTIPYEVEYRLRTKQNKYVWFFASGETLRDAEGNPKKFAGTIRNINRRKKAERDLAEQTAIVKGILNASVNSIIAVNVRGIITSVNHATQPIFGYHEDELIGKNIQMLLASEEGIMLENSINTVRESVARRKDGSLLPVDISVSETTLSEDNRKIYVMIFRDTSQRKEKEKILAESEDRFRKLNDASLEGILFHEQGLVIDANKAFCTISGFKMEEVIDMNFYDRLSEEGRMLARQKDQDNDERPYEVEFMRKNGEMVPLELWARGIVRDGSFTRVISVRDISQRKKAEQEQRRLIDVLDTLPECVSYTDASGTIKYINRAGLKMLGYDSVEEVVNHSISLIHPQEVINKFIQDWLPSSIHHGSLQTESVVTTKDGKAMKVSQTIIAHLNRMVTWNMFLLSLATTCTRLKIAILSPKKGCEPAQCLV